MVALQPFRRAARTRRLLHADPAGPDAATDHAPTPQTDASALARRPVR